VALTDLATATIRERFKKSDTDMKTRQSCKIRELGNALITEGLLTLDQQAKALGLGRSTAWTILKANHKASGLSAAIINRMLGAPRLPALVRAKILEYIDEKNAGVYGHNKIQLRRFTSRLSVRAVHQARAKVEPEDCEVERINFAPRELVAFPDRRLKRASLGAPAHAVGFSIDESANPGARPHPAKLTSDAA
jgi:predicted DNA-binding transcriptional regulator AlpA